MYHFTTVQRFAPDEAILELWMTEVAITQRCPATHRRRCKQGSHLYSNDNNGTQTPFCKPLMPPLDAYMTSGGEATISEWNSSTKPEPSRVARVILHPERLVSEGVQGRWQFVARYRRQPDAIRHGCVHSRRGSHNRRGGKPGPRSWSPRRLPRGPGALPPRYPKRAGQTPRIHQTGRRQPRPGRALQNRRGALHASAM